MTWFILYFLKGGLQKKEDLKQATLPVQSQWRAQSYTPERHDLLFKTVHKNTVLTVKQFAKSYDKQD